MGLGIGRVVDAAFRPCPENVHEARPSGHIPLLLRDTLVSHCNSLLARLEEAARALAEDEKRSSWPVHTTVSFLARTDPGGQGRMIKILLTIFRVRRPSRSLSGNQIV